MGKLKMRDMDLHTFEVDLGEDKSLDRFEQLLTRYNQWREFKREVRLAGLLNSGKKIQFEIEDANLLLYTDDDGIQYIHKACFRTDTLTFILKDDEILSLTLTGEILPNTMGEAIKGIVKAGIELKVKCYEPAGNTMFYFELNEPKAA